MNIQSFFIVQILGRCLIIIDKNKFQIDEEIRDKEIRLIAADGSMLGVVSSKEGQRIANESNLQLVKISPNANPPVCKVMDYGKFLYEQSKKDKLAKSTQQKTIIKEIRLSRSIESHDLNVKVNHACKFLQDGNKVKVTVKFKGREVSYMNLGQDVLNKFTEACNEFGIAEKPPKLEGRNMSVVLKPK